MNRNAVSTNGLLEDDFDALMSAGYFDEILGTPSKPSQEIGKGTASSEKSTETVHDFGLGDYGIGEDPLEDIELPPDLFGPGSSVSYKPPAAVAAPAPPVITPAIQRPQPLVQPTAQSQGTQAEERAAALPQKRSKANAFLNLFLYILSIALVAGSALFTFSSSPTKSFFGYRFYTVLTKSMVPNEEARAKGLKGGFGAGSLIFVKVCSPETLKEGDIITFVPGNDARTMLTHRLVEIRHELNGREGLYFVTRGDGNPSEDPPILASMVVGKKVLAIPHVGAILRVVQRNLVLVLVTIVSGFAFIIVLKKYFRGSKVETKKKPGKEIAASARS